MQKMLLGSICLVMVCLILSAGCIADAEPSGENKTYIVGIDRYYPPFSYINANGDPAGFDVESAKWIAEQKGFEIEFKSFAWNELIPALQNGEIDMIYTGLIITPERDTLIDYTNPYWELGLGVAVRDDSEVTMEEITKGEVVLGFVNGTTTEGWLKENIEQYQEKVAGGSVITYNSFALSIVGLQNGGCDAVIFDDAGMKYMIQDKPIRMLGTIETNDKYAIGVRSGDDELRGLLNDGLAELMDSPKWDELIRKYIS